MLWSFIKSSQLVHEGNVWRSVWRICMWILGLKGLRCFTTKMNEWINQSKDFTRNLCQWPAAKHVPSLIFSWFMDSKYTDLPMIFFFIDVISSFNLFNSIESTWSPFGPSTASAWSCNALVESKIAKLNKQ